MNDMEGAERGAIAKLLIQAKVPGTIAMQVKAALYTAPISQVRSSLPALASPASIHEIRHTGTTLT